LNQRSQQHLLRSEKLLFWRAPSTDCFRPLRMVAVLLLKWNEFVKLNVGIPDGLLMNHFMLALQRAHDSIGLGAVEDRQYAVEESAQASAMPFEGFVHSLKLDDISAENREALGHFDALLAATTGLDCTDFADKDKKPDTSETALESAAARVPLCLCEKS